MSIRWIRSVLVDGERATLEIQFGTHSISDKCYVRVNNEKEHWFYPKGDTREDILDQGIELLKGRLQGHSIQTPAGGDFSWQ